MLVRIVNQEDPDQTNLGLRYLSMPFCRQLVFEILEHLTYLSKMAFFSSAKNCKINI